MVSAASIPLSRKFGLPVKYIKGAAIGLSVLSLGVPFMNLCIYRRLKRVLSASPHTRVANPCTFNGKEGQVRELGLPRRNNRTKVHTSKGVGNKKGSDVHEGVHDEGGRGADAVADLRRAAGGGRVHQGRVVPGREVPRLVIHVP